MTVFQADPLCDPRWHNLILAHPRSSAFHTAGWLEALRRTYGYRPIAFTTSAPSEPLDNMLVFCEVSSWATGKRLVSLPFSDHCDPLVDRADDLLEVTGFLSRQACDRGWKYIELRPRSDPHCLSLRGDFTLDSEFWLHTLDLRGELQNVLQRCHPDCVRRKVRRAEREGLRYEQGRSEALLEKFYLLLVRTRRRHSLPPQPIAWFKNLLACLGESVQIRVASKGNVPTAAIVTLAFRNTVTYKYGCSDASFHNLGGMPWLFWHTIQEAKAAGFHELDLGRCDCDNMGLAAFKEHLGATRSRIAYHRYPAGAKHGLHHEWITRIQKPLFTCLPDSLLRATGRLIYRHIG